MPAAVTPQVWATPPVTAAKLTPGGACTSTGLDWLVVVPSPSWPKPRSEEHTSELQSQSNLVCRLLLEKKKENQQATKEFQVQIPASYVTSSILLRTHRLPG